MKKKKKTLTWLDSSSMGAIALARRALIFCGSGREEGYPLIGLCLSVKKPRGYREYIVHHFFQCSARSRLTGFDVHFRRDWEGSVLSPPRSIIVIARTKKGKAVPASLILRGSELSVSSSTSKKEYQQLTTLLLKHPFGKRSKDWCPIL